MSHKLIDELQKENLCTHLVLPLLRLNKFSFISSNFVNCYLSIDKAFVVVQIIDLSLESRKVLRSVSLKVIYADDSYKYLVYRLKPKWLPDVDLFLKGKFSKMSEEAKEEIRRYSGLDYRVRGKNGIRETHGILMALDKNPGLRGMWEEVLTYRSPGGTVNIPHYMEPNMELLSIPDKRTFIDLSLLTQIKENPL